MAYTYHAVQTLCWDFILLVKDMISVYYFYFFGIYVYTPSLHADGWERLRKCLLVERRAFFMLVWYRISAENLTRIVRVAERCVLCWAHGNGVEFHVEKPSSAIQYKLITCIVKP